MGTEENKAVVRRFMHELLAQGSLAVADEVLAPDYVNVALGGADASAVKSMVTAMNAVLKGQRFEDEELVAEGDVVTARFNHILTLPDGSTVEARTLAYYRLVDGRIVVNDVMSVPNLMEVLGPLMAPPKA
jgi:predicted SnoaL-like aldol condensation-catalyzing enzyme